MVFGFSQKTTNNFCVMEPFLPLMSFIMFSSSTVLSCTESGVVQHWRETECLVSVQLFQGNNFLVKIYFQVNFEVCKNCEFSGICLILTPPQYRKVEYQQIFVQRDSLLLQLSPGMDNKVKKCLAVDANRYSNFCYTKLTVLNKYQNGDFTSSTVASHQKSIFDF